MKISFVIRALLPTLAATLCVNATQDAETLQVFQVAPSSRVAIETPATTFAMPVSGLRFEPLVDVQARNLAEGQADIAVRGGIFENTGISVGGSSFYDPQTGHYTAEIPIAPQMLGAPLVLTGLDNAASGFNANAANIRYVWRKISTRGALDAGLGENDSQRFSGYVGQVFGDGKNASQRIAADVDYAFSRSDGPILFGDHEFSRVAARIQLQNQNGQTDLFAGYQDKFFGWPKLYSPSSTAETEHIKTTVFALNHRQGDTASDYWQASLLWRRNRDDYEFNRAIPGQFNPFLHTTYATSFALEGAHAFSEISRLFVRSEILADKIQSTSLTFGPFRTRQYLKLAAISENKIRLDEGTGEIRVGMNFDDDNRGSSAAAPLVELAWKTKSANGNSQRLYAQFSGASQVAGYTALKSNPAGGLFRGNQSLGRQRSRNWEAGAEITRDAWTARGAVFLREDRELVDWTFTFALPNARTANAVDTDTTGAEIAVEFRSEKTRVIASYAWLEKDATYLTSSPVDASFYALNFPNHRATLAVIHSFSNWAELRMDNEYRVQEKNALRQSSRRSINSALAVVYKPTGKDDLHVTLQVENMFGTRFEEVPSVPATPRQYTASIGYRW